jgi:hypothetical protein
MKRVLISATAALSLTLGAAVANADLRPGLFAPRLGPPTAVTGTVVSVNPGSGQFVADANVVGASSQTGGTTPVTITTNSSTRMRVNGQTGTVANLSPGDRFFALFRVTPGSSLAALVANPAIAIWARTPPKPRQLYAFVGTVTAVDMTGSVTVSVSASRPHDLVPTGTPPVSFTVSPNTLVLGGTGGNGFTGGSLANVSVGDVVAGALIAPGGETLTQIELVPLRILLDIPVPPTTGITAARRAKAQALEQALGALRGSPSRRGHTRTHKKLRAHRHA